jgi:acetyl esterase/lipase
MSAFQPDLKRGRFLPNVSYGRLSSRIVRRVKWRAIDPGPDVTVQEIVVPGPKGAPPVSLRVFQPTGLKTAAPALLWIHGGGLIFGAPEQDDRTTSPASSASPSPRSVTDWGRTIPRPPRSRTPTPRCADWPSARATCT